MGHLVQSGVSLKRNASTGTQENIALDAIEETTDPIAQ